ncbi:ser/Thr protein phosphatase family protein [Nemania sp. NC0429]|nr:ser/Thr protein phosphatase family protein [Nemania sp. NC0429]
MDIATRILIISDTHGENFDIKPEHKADVAIHCGDLTDESKLDEYRRTLQLLKEIDAPLKLVIGGNHDFTLDTSAFEQKINEAIEPLEPDLVRKEYGDYGEARRLFEAPGIILLDEGTYKFKLSNGASLTVYASPYTASTGGNAYQYHPNIGHRFEIGKNTDIVITHGPPHGIMDRTCQGRKGCAQLFHAVAKARPRLHCFGHIHEEWGAKLVVWKETTSKTPSHFTDIDNTRSIIIDTLKYITESKRDTPEETAEKLGRAEQYRHQGYRRTSHCQGDQHSLKPGHHTLCVNAAVEGITDSFPRHPPWVVDIELPPADTGK